MSDYFDDDDGGESPEQALERVAERYVERARGKIVALLSEQPESVFYGRQLQLLLEKEFFHWITSKASNELAAEGKIRSERLPLPGYGGTTQARFYFANGLRYWKRRAIEATRLISVYSDPALTAAVGHHAEMLFDAALARGGFVIEGTGTREYKGRKWEETEHDLDRIYVRDGIAYGAEIRNKLAYPDFGELSVKMRICRQIQVTPLFIARMLPKSWIYDIQRAGGFSLIFKYQLYPFGQEKLVEELKARLGLPVGCPNAIERGTVQRLLNFHTAGMRRV